MKELLPEIGKWIDQKKTFAIARVIQTWGSSPRPVGSALIISSDNEMAGSVSGGCVEGAVVKEAKEVIASQGGKLLAYGVNDDEAWSVGLTCGGKIQIYLQPFPAGKPQREVWEKLLELLSANKNCVLVTALRDGENQNTLITPEGIVIGAPLPHEIEKQAVEAFLKRNHNTLELDQIQYFVQVFPKRRQLLIIGAAHITADLVHLAKLHDFDTIVIDPRGTFARNTNFVVAPDRIEEKYPSEVLNELTLDSNTYAVILSHDLKIDDNALHILLRSKLAYIGALGSRKTHEKRIERLKLAGFSEEEINRIESPVGMDINAQGSKEIALSILGSIIKVKNAPI